MKEILRAYFNEEFVIRKEEYKKAEDNLHNLITEYEEDLVGWFEYALGCEVTDLYYIPCEDELRLYLYTDKEFNEIWDKICSLDLPFNVLPIITEPNEDEEI